MFFSPTPGACNNRYGKRHPTQRRKLKKRIDGAPSFIKAPGMVWTHPHQVIGITEGPKFSVEGPGLNSLKKGKQPFDIVDLRDQFVQINDQSHVERWYFI